jgi:hypothetical protein
MRAEWPFRGRLLAHGALYEELLCQEPEHVTCFFSPIQYNFILSFYFSRRTIFTANIDLRILLKLRVMYSDVKQA